MDTSKLDEGLNKLRGLDFIAAENEERALGNTQPLLSVTSGFQARLAARALNVNVNDIRELPLKEYNRVCQSVFIFLNSTTSEA